MAKILLVHTGGTLGMAGGRPAALRPGPFLRTLKQRVPELDALAEIEIELFSNYDSSEMQPELWSALARLLHERLPHFDGAVITHGTDTLAFTACALSFMLPNLKKAVVLTGSQRPLREIRSDARLNLIDALTSAIRGPKEVTICFDSKLYRGNRTRKVKVAEYDAFESPNYPLLGTLGVEATFSEGLASKGRPALREKLDPRVFLLKVFPGLDPKLPLAILPEVKGLVVEAYGAGNFPIAEELGRSLLPLFREAHRREVPVVVVSQAYRNGVDLDLYQSGAQAKALGAISGRDMTPSAALLKLMHALAYCRTPSEIARYVEEDQAGEIS